MKYLVVVAKHHDGFCMFDTKQTDYNIMYTPFGRDVLKELAAACRKQGLAFGDYSVCDWPHPDFPHGSPGGETFKPHPNLDRYEIYLRRQVEELVRNYGPFDLVVRRSPGLRPQSRRGGGAFCPLPSAGHPRQQPLHRSRRLCHARTGGGGVPHQPPLGDLRRSAVNGPGSRAPR